MFYSIFDQNNEALVSKINVFLNIKNKILLTSKRLKGSVYIYLQIILQITNIYRNSFNCFKKHAFYIDMSIICKAFLLYQENIHLQKKNIS